MGIAAFTRARDRLIEAGQSRLTSIEVCEAVSHSIAEVAPFAAAAVMTTDPETNLPAGGVVTGFEPSACVPFWDNELLDPDFNKFNDMLRRLDPVASLADATDGDVTRSPRFTKLYAAYGASDELRVVLRSGTTSLAIGAFVRCDGTTFSPTELSDVNNLIGPASIALRNTMAQMNEPLLGGAPVVLLLDADGDIVSSSDGATTILDDLCVDSLDEQVPGTIRIAAARARSQRSRTALTTRLRGRSGRWVRIHISPMDGPADIVSVTISSARAGDLVPILLDSFGLTQRESDIVLALCRGLATKEIATELAISVHTVRDHLKAIFDKSGVNSRGELVARLFANHVLGSFEEAVTTLPG